jgi:hypothetical protein
VLVTGHRAGTGIAKANAGVTLSKAVFESRNTHVSAEWQRLKVLLGL